MITILFRTLIVYITLILIMRLMGKRQIGELEVTDLVTTLLISEIASLPITNYEIPVLSAIIPMITLLVLEVLSSWILVRFPRLRGLVSATPTVIIRHGEIRQEAMSRNRLTVDELMEELRCQGVTDLKTVKYAVLETSGQLSVLLYPKDQPLTPAQAGVTVADDLFLPRIIINDGRLLRQNLRSAGYEEKWLLGQLRKAGAARTEDVFLLTVDEAGSVVCVLKEESK